MQNQVTAVTSIDGFRTNIDAAGHALVADEPAAIGGTGDGPSPYELLAAALAACTSMTIRMYAERKGLPLRSVSVSVRHDKVHAEDCRDCETREGRIDEFQREITVDGDLDGAQRERLLYIADRCPVHRTLEGEIKVRTRFS